MTEGIIEIVPDLIEQGFKKIGQIKASVKQAAIDQLKAGKKPTFGSLLGTAAKTWLIGEPDDYINAAKLAAKAVGVQLRADDKAAKIKASAAKKVEKKVTSEESEDLKILKRLKDLKEKEFVPKTEDTKKIDIDKVIIPEREKIKTSQRTDNILQTDEPRDFDDVIQPQIIQPIEPTEHLGKEAQGKTIVNPISGRKIKVDGRTYKYLEWKFNKYGTTDKKEKQLKKEMDNLKKRGPKLSPKKEPRPSRSDISLPTIELDEKLENILNKEKKERNHIADDWRSLKNKEKTPNLKNYIEWVNSADPTDIKRFKKMRMRSWKEAERKDNDIAKKFIQKIDKHVNKLKRLLPKQESVLKAIAIAGDPKLAGEFKKRKFGFKQKGVDRSTQNIANVLLTAKKFNYNKILKPNIINDIFTNKFTGRELALYKKPTRAQDGGITPLELSDLGIKPGTMVKFQDSPNYSGIPKSEIETNPSKLQRINTKIKNRKRPFMYTNITDILDIDEPIVPGSSSGWGSSSVPKCPKGFKYSKKLGKCIKKTRKKRRKTNKK